MYNIYERCLIEADKSRLRYRHGCIATYGGKIIATGGFGCIFSPALRCNGTKNRRKNTVTKLMTSKYAKQEYDNLLKLNNLLDKIPKYEDYFLINDFSICKPAKLTKTDLSNFNKCDALQKKNITKKNINSSLNDILALNIPYGGITIDSFIIHNKNYELNKTYDLPLYVVKEIKNQNFPKIIIKFI
jgi:hypothetical protein